MTRTVWLAGAGALLLFMDAGHARAGAATLAAQPQPGAPGAGGGRLFVSPAGEVYRPGAGGRPFAEWFRRADANGDGTISWDEFRADFARVFATFDTDGDGEIEPEEITHYETQILPEMSSTFAMGRGGGWNRRQRMPRGDGGTGDRPADAPSAEGGGFSTDGGGRGGRRMPAYSASMTGAARFGLLPIPHPIMEADLNFNRGVTRDEWERAAQRRFTALDSAHNGRLTAAGLLQGQTESSGSDPRSAGVREAQRRGDARRPRVRPGAGGTPLPQD